MKQGLEMKFSHSRNEMSRAQSHINNNKVSTEVINGARIANPAWRSVDKKSWVDGAKPFRVVKADKSLISDRNPKHIDLNPKEKDPYTGIKVL